MPAVTFVTCVITGPFTVAGGASAEACAGVTWGAGSPAPRFQPFLAGSGSGVTDTAVGFMGGSAVHPSYEQVCEHGTGHAETVRVTYDPQQTSYAALLDVFFKSHDPTQKNRQGPDVGDQYRSAVFVRDAAQREIAEGKLKDLAASGKYANPIATQVTDAKDFWMAEDYHQHYLLKNGQAQCHTPAGG